MHEREYMSGSNGSGVIRIGKKGLRKFAFGVEGSPGSEVFEVDVVSAIQQWFNVHDTFVEAGVENEEGRKVIPSAEVPRYHQAAVEFVEDLRCTNTKNSLDRGHEDSGYLPVTVAEALDFNARLRECYDELVVFFRPRSREERDSPASSGVALHFSEEGAQAKTPTES